MPCIRGVDQVSGLLGFLGFRVLGFRGFRVFHKRHFKVQEVVGALGSWIQGVLYRFEIAVCPRPPPPPLLNFPHIPALLNLTA